MTACSRYMMVAPWPIVEHQMCLVLQNMQLQLLLQSPHVVSIMKMMLPDALCAGCFAEAAAEARLHCQQQRNRCKAPSSRTHCICCHCSCNRSSGYSRLPSCQHSTFYLVAVSCRCGPTCSPAHRQGHSHDCHSI